MNFSDLYSGSALGGLASGAATGFMASGGNPIGGLVGGGLGLMSGAYSNSKVNDAVAAQSKNLDMIYSNLAAERQKNYARHIADLDKTLAFYGPAQGYWDRLYGGGGATAPGQGSWSGTGVK
jgi:hypothetical protein